MLAVVLALLAPAAGAVAAEDLLVDGPRQLSLPTGNLEAAWVGLGEHDRRRSAAVLIEYGLRSVAARPLILRLLQDRRDHILMAYASAAEQLFSGKVPKPAGNAQEQAVGNFMAAVARARAGGPVEPEALTVICQVPGQDSSCDLARFVAEVHAAHVSREIDQDRLRKILRWGSPFLSREPLRPPFASAVASRTPIQLHGLGLPLEAALLADRLATSAADPLRREVAYFLSSAGDFSAALRYTAAYSHPQREVQLNANLDWLILAGRYRSAIRLILEQGPDRFAPESMGAQSDYWTEFRMRPAVIRLRLALLLYLAGDKRKAVQALESLNEFSGMVYEGEPEKYFARLRLAQLVLKDNPELAHKIAEDISYIAQEKDWRILEYHATLLDGWADYYRKENYKALIAFTKAGGILRGEKRKYATPYSHLLGKLAVRIAMRPNGNHSALIGRINQLLINRPYNEAVFTIREWMPPGNGPDFFMEQAIANMHARGDEWGALNLLLEYSRAEEHFFKPGKNPGGLRGFVMSVQWSREVARFPYLEKWSDAKHELHAAALKHALDNLPSTRARPLTASRLKGSDPYLFSFVLGESRLFYLVHPTTVRKAYWSKYKRKGRWRRVKRYRSVRTVGVDSLRLTGAQVAVLRKACTRGAVKDCVSSQKHFAKLARAVRSAIGRGGHLRVAYDPSLDIDFVSLLALAGNSSPVYFYGQESQPARSTDAAKLQAAQGCGSALATNLGAAQRNFSALFSSSADKPGIWIWPAGLDAARDSRGGQRPVYLRNFTCGRTSLRFWEMDRFSGGTAPALVIFDRRSDEPALNRAFARHFAERGTMLAEVARGSEPQLAKLLGKLGSNVSAKSLLQSYEALGSPAGIRLILPSVFDG